MLHRSALKSAMAINRSSVRGKNRLRRVEWKRGGTSGVIRGLVLIVGLLAGGSFPTIVRATHEADHRFTVEGFVCEPDGKGSPNVEVLIKDTRIAYGQTVTTGSDGYYKATFHLHNDNLGDPLLVEAKGEQQHHKVQFDPKDLETERRIQVNFGTGCIYDPSTPPRWFLSIAGVAAVGVGGFVGSRFVRAWRKRSAQQERGRKGHGKRKR